MQLPTLTMAEVQVLKQEALLLVRESKVTHLEALNGIAQKHGYRDWYHVTQISLGPVKAERSLLESDNLQSSALTTSQAHLADAPTHSEPRSPSVLSGTSGQSPSTAPPTVAELRPDDFTTWASLETIRSYFDALAQDPLAEAQYHPLKGNVVIDVTIEGTRFQAAFFDNELMIGLNREFSGPLGIASIADRSRPGRNTSPNRFDGWAICKYENQVQFPLFLTAAGLRRLSLEFGMPIIPVFRERHRAMHVSEAACFYNSQAFSKLRDWVLAHPRKVNKMGPSAYLYNWKEAALTGRLPLYTP